MEGRTFLVGVGAKHICACTVKLYGISKGKNALAKPARRAAPRHARSTCLITCCHPQNKPMFTTAYKYDSHRHGCKVAGSVSGDVEASNLLVFWCVVFCRWVLFSMFRRVLEPPFSWVKQYNKNELSTSGTPIPKDAGSHLYNLKSSGACCP